MARTRREIQNEINYNQRIINGCADSKQHYNTALGNARKMETSLKTSLKCLNEAKDTLRHSFNIGGRAMDAGTLDQTIDEVQSGIQEINNRIVPYLNQCIKDMNNAINYRNNQNYKLRKELAQATE